MSFNAHTPQAGPSKSTTSLPAHMQPQDQEPHAHEADLETTDAPPPYSMDYSTFRSSGSALATSASVSPEDGRIHLSLLKKFSLPKLPERTSSLPEYAVDPEGTVPPLNIVIFVVGSRGDVQPFIPLAHGLQNKGHRVRLGTHAVFERFVLEQGIEFFDIGGDPAELMSYMVKNPGLLPGFDSLRKGDIPKKRKMIREILNGCWRACYEPDAVSGMPFAADAIIANPPSFAHIHCAEALSIPLHIVFTMPWISTQSFPHPLVKISSSNTEPGMSNFLSYSLVDLLTWQGLGDIINSFRSSTLGLRALGVRSGALILERLRVPTAFCWSPALIPKPEDWGNHVDVTGFTFLESGPSFQPPKDLVEFLEGGEAPVYIGFGSVPVTDPIGMTKILFSAVAASGVRALISIGWGKLGEGLEVPPGVFLVGNVPHDWLFKRVKAVVHHGGAGTSAIAVKEGKPGLIVPFFGDQPFWGEMVFKAGAGPEPIPHKQLTTENLTAALEFLVQPETLKAAQKLGETIREEDGVKRGIESFEKHLPLLNMRCDLDSARAAAWWCPSQYLRLSPFAAQVLSDAHKLDVDELRPHRVKSYQTRAEYADPLSGASFVCLRIIMDYTSSFGEMLVNPVKGIQHNVTAIPLGMANIVGSISEGTRNLPKSYGSAVRRTGEITGWKSGLKAAGKGLYFGVQDGLTGLVTEPYRGAVEEGGIGALKGVGRGIGNLILKPAAGGLGLVEHSAVGAWTSISKRFGPQVERLSKQASSREWQGITAVDSSTTEERQAILDRWEVLVSQKKERKARMKKDVEEWYRGMEAAGMGELKDNIIGEMRKGGFDEVEAPSAEASTSQVDWAVEEEKKRRA
ncbi:hypothetical protein BCR35DRAFT_302858 [Leucosporidium creatinivorum]|uniref:Uncharacterized protein n=1 Tax=Leucosporidium creatinivorum TaxID=106004 RepID=A0A1Y2FN85_9BASI|nr:hypothetical protein BCR35DRAFT_302858 [Leucosporidium creatinivorum]